MGKEENVSGHKLSHKVNKWMGPRSPLTLHRSPQLASVGEMRQLQTGQSVQVYWEAASSLVQRKLPWGDGGKGEEKERKRRGRRRKGEETKMSVLYWDRLLGEGSLSSRLESSVQRVG